MITVVLVADSGAALESMTRSVSTLAHASISRHCHGHTPIGPALARYAPDVVLVDEMQWPGLALQRIDEIHLTLPQARIVVRAARPEAGWLAEAFRAGASAVIPATAGPGVRERVLADAVGPQELEVHAHPGPLMAA